MNGNFRVGDIVFVRGNSIFSKLINWFDGEFSHCAIIVQSNGKCVKIIESQRFVKSRIVDFYFDDYVVVPMYLSELEQIKLLKSSIRYCGKPYDYKQLISIGFKKIFGLFKTSYNNKRKYICSELVELILNSIGKIEANNSLGEKSPNELYLYLKNLN